MTRRPAQITEVRRHLDGRVERFACALVALERHRAVVRFDHTTARRTAGTIIPAGSRSYGFFWRRRPYVLYRIEDSSGVLLAHRFDVVEDVRLSEREVSYTDLLLDLWVDASGNAHVEDEDEMADFARRGLLTRAQRETIERARELLLRRYRAIAREAARIVRAQR